MVYPLAVFSDLILQVGVMSDKTQLEQIAELLVGHCFMPPDHDLDTGDMELEMARNVAQQILDICQPQCEWKMSNDGFYDVWESTCGNSFVLNDGSPEDNEMNYCSHCGGKLIQPIPEDTA